MEKPSDDSDACIRELDAWILEKKKAIYEKNIKATTNTAENISKNGTELKVLSNTLKSGIRNRGNSNGQNILKEVGWPDKLKECINDVNIRTDIEQRITYWLEEFIECMSLEKLKENIKESK